MDIKSYLTRHKFPCQGIVEFITVRIVINKIKTDQHKLKYQPLDSPVKLAY